MTDSAPVKHKSQGIMRASSHDCSIDRPDSVGNRVKISPDVTLIDRWSELAGVSVDHGDEVDGVTAADEQDGEDEVDGVTARDKHTGDDEVDGALVEAEKKFKYHQDSMKRHQKRMQLKYGRQISSLTEEQD